MNDKIEVLISKQDIEKRIVEIADDIMAELNGEDLVMICILKGGVFFMVDLARAIKQNVELDFMAVKSYYDGKCSSGVINVQKDISDNIEGKNVIIVEDIIDSGRTLSHVFKLLKTRNPKSLKICTLLDKTEARVIDCNIDYVGFTIPNEFVVGYGLDYAGKYRNLDYIGFLCQQ